MPDRKQGRGQQSSAPAVATFATAHKINLIQTVNINHESEAIAQLKNSETDFFIVLAFAQFLSSEILKIPKLGCFNIHTSLLPKYRGAAPIQYALLNGDYQTGVSIQKMVKEMDAGDLVKSTPIDIYDYENADLLYTRLKLLAAISLGEFIDDIIADKVSYTVQDKKEISFAPIIKKEDGKIDFFNMSCLQVINMVKAFTPRPGPYIILHNKKRLKITQVEKFDHLPLAAGEIDTSLNYLLIGCRDGIIRASKVQLEGKKASCDSNFLNGLQNKISLHKD